MAPFFTFFVDKAESNRCAPYIKKLDRYYPSFVDGIYVSPPDMKKRYANSNAKFFAFDFEDLIMFDLDTVSEIEPLLMLSMDKCTRMSAESWKVVYLFLQAVFNDEYVDLEEISKLVPPPVQTPEQIQLHKSIQVPTETAQDYGFCYSIEDDIGYCQINKPYTDRPYTAVIRNFERVGFEPLFTALYVASSWGVCSHDHMFLIKLWQHLNMNGNLDLENRLACEIKLCQEGKPEPELYRLCISDVKEQLAAKQKRRRVETVDPNKFIKL